MNLGQENEQQEFKLSLGQLDKGLKSLTAMLNRSQAGTVYFGVKDDGEVAGLSIGKHTLLDIRSRAAELIEPRVILNLQVLQDEEGRCFIRTDARGSDIPYSCDGRYFVRTASADEQVGSELLRKMLASGNTDLLSSVSANDQTLSFQGLILYLNARGIHAEQRREFYDSFGLYNREGKFNLMAYLLSDQNESGLKVMRFSGTDKTAVAERMSFSGQCLLQSVQDVLEYFRLMSQPRKVDLETGIRAEIPLFDYQAFREAWINACVHNAWTEQVPPSVYVYDDRIEVISCGGLPYGLSKEGFFAGISKPVNHRLFSIFITCGLAEQSGHGIPQIVKACGTEAFQFRDGMLMVTLPFLYEPESVAVRRIRQQAQLKLSQNQRQVLSYLRDHPRASLQETADACSLSLGGVKKMVSKLQELRLLQRQGAKKKSTWIVL